jgi:DNA-binding response OmpR family regulator
MVIDDEKILSKHLKIKLERNGYEVTLIESFTHFLSQSNLAEIDLFLIDISL